ncbi:hypothetical protein CFB48_19315 [Burkholderia sp. AU33647]|nr:hypothetical protein CFB48_19315 [Burkholderia sp. AU33647]
MFSKRGESRRAALLRFFATGADSAITDIALATGDRMGARISFKFQIIIKIYWTCTKSSIPD